MKAKYVPAALVILGLIAIQLGVFSPLRGIAVLPWGVGLLLFVISAVVATVQFRRNKSTGQPNTTTAGSQK